MDLKMVITGLTGQIGELEHEIKDIKTEKEVLELMDSLKNIKNPTLGYNKMFLNQPISKDAMEEFVSLLEADEYLKGQSNRGRSFGGEHKRESTFDHYYLTFGEGTLLELTFRESEFKGYEEISRDPIKECGVSCKMYISEEDLVFQTSYEYGFPMLKMNQGENEIFSSPTPQNDYSQCNGRKVNEVLSPISPQTLIERFYEKKQQEVNNDSEEREQEPAPTPEEVNNDSEENEINKITAQFQRIANNYEMARKHSMLGFNMGGIIDRAIDNLYSLEQEVTEKYQGKELYDIICSLQTNLTGIESCKNHIIYALETSLFDQIAKDKQTAPSDKINTNIAYGYTTLNERNSKGISDFVERVNSYPIEERCAIITGIAKQYADKNLPSEAVTVFHNIREGIFQETFSDQSTKNIVKQ